MPPSKPAIIDKDAAARLRLVMAHLGFKQQRFADELEISQPFLNQLLKGVREIPQKVLKLLFIKFNIAPTYVVAGEGSMLYKKEPTEKQLLNKIKNMEADIELLKAEVFKRKFINQN